MKVDDLQEYLTIIEGGLYEMDIETHPSLSATEIYIETHKKECKYDSKNCSYVISKIVRKGNERLSIFRYT